MTEEQRARILHVATTVFYNALVRIDHEVNEELMIERTESNGTEIMKIVLQAFKSACTESEDAPEVESTSH